MTEKASPIEAKVPEEALVPIDTIEKVADAQASELWGAEIGRGEPIPLYDASGLYGYIVPYIRGTKQFPPAATLFRQIRALRKEFDVGAMADHMPAAYYSALRQMGEGFGSICVSARSTDGPILWMAHFLAPHFILGELAQKAARQKLGGRQARLARYYYFSPEEQYMEFSSGAKKQLMDACVPGRRVPKDVLKRRPSRSRPKEMESESRAAWLRLTGGDPGTASRDLPPGFPPGTGIPPRGIPADDIAATHTKKKIAYWELVPKVDHTTKNWCVPSSWAMLLGFYDNYVEGVGTVLGYGRLIDYWYEMTPGGHNLPNLIDDLLTGKASAINNYAFPEAHSNGDKTQQWNMLKGEIDAGRPCFFNIPGHTTTAIGYRVDNNGIKYAIVYDPPNPSTPTYENEYLFSKNDGIGKVVLAGGTNGEDLVLDQPYGGATFTTAVPNEIVWFMWGNSIKKTRLSVSYDGGNTWQIIADNISTKGAWNGYAWIPATTGTRLRVKVEGLSSNKGLIAADGSLKNNTIKTAPAGTAWKKIWGPTSLVVAGSVSGKTDPLIFAVPSNADGIYRYDGVPMAWTKVGGPGKTFVLDDYGHLYRLSPDGSGVYWYSGTTKKWTQIGGPAGAIFAGGNLLFATNPQTGDIYQYAGQPMAWTKVGGPGKMFSVDRSGRLYGISPNGSAIFHYLGTPLKWVKIAQQATTAIYSGGCGLYATGGNANDVYLYSLVPELWTKLGGPGKMFAVDDAGRLVGLSPDGSAVFRYEGAWNAPVKWKKVWGAAGKIFAAGNGRLFATNPQTNDLWSYE